MNKDLLRANSFAQSLAKLQSECSDKDIIAKMKEAPYMGVLDVHFPYLENCGFSMLQLNDDGVAGTIFWRTDGLYEPGSLFIWSTFAARVSNIADIGSYTGIYSLLCATVNPKAKIHAFEIVSYIYSRLINNCQINGFRIHCHRLALCDTNKIAELSLRFGPPYMSTGTSILSGDNQSSFHEQVRYARYDDLGLPAPELVKIDVEGAECIVLKGMKGSLKRRPYLLMEVLSNQPPDEILSFLPPDYSFYFIDESTNRITKPLTNNKDIWRRSSQNRNLFFYPNECYHNLIPYCFD